LFVLGKAWKNPHLLSSGYIGTQISKNSFYPFILFNLSGVPLKLIGESKLKRVALSIFTFSKVKQF
jgi:hypothetical protein